MKKLLLLVALVTMFSTQSFADRYTEDLIDSLIIENNTKQRLLDSTEMRIWQNSVWRDHASFYNISYQLSHLANPTVFNPAGESLDLAADNGLALSVGRQCYLHRKAIGNVIKFGLDFVFADLSWSKYTLKNSLGETYNYKNDLTLHQIDVGVGVGLSMTIRFASIYKFNLYGRYMPSASLLLSIPKKPTEQRDPDNTHEYTYCDVSYAGVWTPGIAFCWSAASLGVEWRLKNTVTFDGFSGENINYTYSGGDDYKPSEYRDYDLNSVRVYFGLRF